jgi:hypothetical protein
MIKSKYKNTCEDYSISKILREQKKSNDYFEILLNNLTLEEIIALKLELTYKSIGFVLHGFPLWSSTNYIVKDALLKYAVSASKTKTEARKLLGLTNIKFFRLLKKYKINKYFKPEENINDYNRTTIKKDLS